jgi:CRISPR/Cas system-associated exonuclease Cas4 (RecB family)
MEEPNFYEIFKQSKTKHVQEDYVKQIGIIHVSTVPKCIRSSYYSYFMETKYDDVTKLIFRAGEEIHKQMKDAILLKYPDAIFEAKVNLKLSNCTIEGHIDVEVPNQFLVEIKSTAWPKKEPDKNHLMQLNSYLIMKKMKVGYLVYVTKNTLIPKQFKVEADTALWKTTTSRILKLHSFLLKGELPPAEFWHQPETDYADGKNWWCKNCFYRQECIDNINLGNKKELQLAINNRIQIAKNKAELKEERQSEEV